LFSLYKPSSYRRSLVIGLVAVLAISFLFAGGETFGATPAISDSEWAMFRHDLSHSGSTPSTAPDVNNTVWSYPTGGGVVWSSPAVVDGKVYVGSYDNKVYCLNAETGVYIWSYITGGIVESSPAVVDGKVYIGSGDKKIYCLDASTGAHIWNYTTGSFVYSSPAVVDGRVYVGSDDKKIYCLNAANGDYLWSYTTGDMLEVSSPAVIADRVYVGSMDSKVYCLNATTGAHLWNYKTGGYVWSSPAVLNGKVYVGSEDFKVYCLDSAAGSLVWSYTTGNPVRSSPAIVGNNIYVGSYDDRVYCLDALTGTYIWSYKTTENVNSSPAVADGKVYVGSGDFNFYCLNASTGGYIWSYKAGNGVLSSPAVVAGKIYVGSWDSKVYCFGLTTSPPIQTPESWAIIVGVSDYQYLDNLSYCDDDARSLYNQLSSAWGTDHIKLLIDSNATKAAIFNAITTWLSDREDSDDTVLFFFSGHGGQGADLAPIDEADNLDEYICPTDSLTSYWTNDIRDDEFSTWLNVLDAGKIVTILNSCYSGGFIGDTTGKDLSKEGRIILTACAENEEAYAISTLGYGIFSNYIIDALNKLELVDVNVNHEVSAEEIFNYAEAKVLSFNAQLDTPQHPAMYDGFAGELPLVIITLHIQYSLNVVSAHGIPNPSVGNHAYGDGSSVTCSVVSPVTEGNTVWTCTGWTGTGSVLSSGSGTSSTFTITQNSNLTWNWQGTPLQYTISSSASSNGAITPSGSVRVNHGSSQSFTIIPNSGYYIASIATDAGSVTITSPSGQTVSFTNVNAAHTVTATFALTPTTTPIPTPNPTSNNPTPSPSSKPTPVSTPPLTSTPTQTLTITPSAAPTNQSNTTGILFPAIALIVAIAISASFFTFKLKKRK
jgi:outer membrane protein assembly factor BamB